MKNLSCFIVFPLFLITSLPILAADAKQPNLAEEDSSQNSYANPGTTIIGGDEAPTGLNIVPWKEESTSIQKNTLSSQVLEQVLHPLDRNVLLREVEYFHLLRENMK